MKKEKIDLLKPIKKKLLEAISQYLQDQIKNSKKEILRTIEKRIERKIKKEIKKITKKVITSIIILMLISIGTMFLIYGAIQLIFEILNINQTFLNLTYGLFLILISSIIYILKK